MNSSVLIVLPILTILMFDLGINLKLSDFVLLFKRPKSILIGLFGQLIILPAIAFAIASFFDLEPLFFIGLILIACCPGGSSSNIFSMVAKGDIALSVSLTAFSSIITLFTVPMIMHWTTSAVGEAVGITLPVGNLLIQNLFTMLVPIILGILLNHFFKNAALKMDKVLSKCAFPAILFLATFFFIQNREAIGNNLNIFSSIGSLIILAITISALFCVIFKLNLKERRTIIIEVGMQNAAQAIAIATSPFIFNSGIIAVPAIIYALLMNVILLIYVGFIKFAKK